MHWLLVFPHSPLFVDWEYRAACFDRCAVHRAWGLVFSVPWWHVSEQDLGWHQQEAAVLGGRLLHKSMAHVVCFHTSSSSSDSEITCRNVSSGCRMNCFVVSSHHPQDQTSLVFFWRLLCRKAFLEKLIYLIVIQASVLGESYFSSTMQLITAWGCTQASAAHCCSVKIKK